MICVEFRENLQGYIDLELSPERESSCRDHLLSCDPCQALVEAEEPTSMFSRIGSASQPDPSEDDALAFLAAVRTGIAQREAETSTRSRPAPRLTRLSWAAVFTFGALALGILLGGPSSDVEPVGRTAMVDVSVDETLREALRLDAGESFTPGIESLDLPDASVVNVLSTAEDEAQFVFIVAEGLDI